MDIDCKYVRLSPAELRRALDEPVWAQEHIDGLGDAWLLSIEKSWHHLYYLFGVHGGMAVDFVHGGTELPLEDGGFGPPRYLTPEEVGSAAGFLSGTSFDELAPHFRREDMVYAGLLYVPWTDDEVPAVLDELRRRYDELTRFFSDAGKAGDAVVVTLG